MSKTSRLPILNDWTDVDAALLTLRQLTASRMRLEADLNAALAAAGAPYAPELARISERIAEIEAHLEAYADAHRPDFAGKQSVERPHGTLCYRQGNPAVRLLNRKWSWEKVLSALEQYIPKFVRTVPEVNKVLILSDHALKQISDETLAQVGLKVAADEKFRVELNLEQAPASVAQPPSAVA